MDTGAVEAALAAEAPEAVRTIVEVPTAAEDQPPWYQSLGAGLLMGCADAVPGVSASTIALIIGVYERFIAALGGCIDWARGLVLPSEQHPRPQPLLEPLVGPLRLLVPLGVGMLTAYYFVTLLLVGPDEDPGLLRIASSAPYVYAFFAGLVLASLAVPWRRRRHPEQTKHGAYALIAFVLTFTIVGLPFATSKPPLWALPLGGMLGVSVMLLPGVSGSLMLLMIGQYTTVSGALHDRDLVVISVFAVGLVLGAALFVPVMRWLLEHRHDATLAVLTGMMAGSLRSLWPWKENYDLEHGALVNAAPFGGAVEIFGIAFAVAAGVLCVLALGRLERRLAPELVIVNKPDDGGEEDEHDANGQADDEGEQHANGGADDDGELGDGGEHGTEDE